MSEETIFYRIGVINDFKNEFAFIEYRDYGELKIWNSCAVRCEHRGHQLAKDSIGVFLNFELVGEFRSFDEANALIRKLIAQAPTDLTEFASIVYAG